MSTGSEDPRIADLSEGQILREILARTGSASETILGPGDDAAVISTPSGSVVATTDTLVHGPDFRLAWTSGYDLGWKAAAVNLADVAAMGARPTALLAALAVPRALRLSFVTDMADGFRDACDAMAPGCAIVGGDLTVSETLTVAVTALGDLEGRHAVTRSGARVGDVIAVAGELGRSAAGLALLFSRFHRDGQPIPVLFDGLTTQERDEIAAQLRPTPPVRLGPLAAAGGATAMMDVSDGLALDAGRLATSSGVTLTFESTALGGDARRALIGGEDHALLATFPTEALPDGFRAVGVVVPAGSHTVLCDGDPVDAHGWDPYRDWDSGTDAGSSS